MMSKARTTLVPKEGWVIELKKADEESKKKKTASVMLRVSTACYHLRKWRKCKTAASLGLSMITDHEHEDIKKKLQEHETIATKEYEADKNRPDRSKTKAWLAEVRKMDQSIDYSHVGHETFGNLNFLHYAAYKGDIHLLEEVVAFGAAIDFPVHEENKCNTDAYPAPPGCTALLLACTALAAQGKVKAKCMMPRDLLENLKGILECAIALVHLGADCDIILRRPTSTKHRNSHLDPNILFQALQLYGKTARELADISGETSLIDAMKKFETKQDLIDNAHCRCGSRLPWLQCHAGETHGGYRTPYYMECNGRLAFRLSPLARCPCKHTEKSYWNCCWFETSRPSYQNDVTSELTGTERFSIVDPPIGQIPSSLISPILANWGAMDRSLLPSLQDFVDFIRSTGRMDLVKTHPNSKIKSWEVDVYVGCFDRIEDGFLWNDCHWKLNTTELLAQVEEWNHALELYCKDKGLTGSRRESVIATHTASPFAPCGNPSCSARETECKEYLRCARCKSIAYCGPRCQKRDWKRHKLECCEL